MIRIESCLIVDIGTFPLQYLKHFKAFISRETPTFYIKAFSKIRNTNSNSSNSFQHLTNNRQYFKKYYFHYTEFDTSSFSSKKNRPNHDISSRLGEGNAFTAVKYIAVRERGTYYPRVNVAADFIRFIQCVSP